MSDTQALFESFCGIMETLTGENGCPWDKGQTHESLRPYLLEESYEVAEAIDNGDSAALCEELGDVLMLTVFHAKLGEREGSFTMDDVINGISRKMIRRHSHIFGEDRATTAEEVEAFWEANKKSEKNYQNTADLLRAVPKSMPALMRAEKVLKRAQKAEGKTDSTTQLFGEAHALLNDLEASAENDANTFDRFGKLLFNLVKLSVIIELNAEFSLTNKVEAFINSY